MQQIQQYSLHLLRMSPYFTIEILSLSTTLLKMKMQMQVPLFHTAVIPQTIPLLQKHLPSVLGSKCFNQTNEPFISEVQHTEMGHLFEHIMLDYLCIEKLKLGQGNVIYNGVTYWNWKKDPRGTFYIAMDASIEEKDVILTSLKKTGRLVNRILDSVLFESMELPKTNRRLTMSNHLFAQK